MLFSFSVATPLSDELETDVFFPTCHVLAEDRESLTDFVLLDVINYDDDIGDELVSSILCLLRLSGESSDFQNPQ